jgi:hypothetical protein
VSLVNFYRGGIILKVCARCKQSKNIERFSKNPQQKDGRHVYCKDCMKLYSRKYYIDHRQELIERERQKVARDPEKHKAYQKEYRRRYSNEIRFHKIQKYYGITEQEWYSIFHSQDNRCSICCCEDPGKKGWSTDHDHKTGKVRGILCSSCNNGLGRFKDNPDSLKRAAEYLLKFEASLCLDLPQPSCLSY